MTCICTITNYLDVGATFTVYKRLRVPVSTDHLVTRTNCELLEAQTADNDGFGSALTQI
jgi:hypothetical protein